MLQAVFPESAVIFVIGAGLVAAFLGAALLRRIGFPQIVGFMLAGVVLHSFGILTGDTVDSLGIIVSLALGLIGYNIGLELRGEIFSGRLKGLSLIVIVEAMAAFWIVTLLTLLVVNEPYIALIFGALASATAPAATADVIWEYKCKGPLTESVMFILAMDDLVAVILTNTAFAYAVFVLSPIPIPAISIVVQPLIMTLGSATLGGLFGGIFVKFVNREKNRAKLVELELGLVLLLVGLVDLLGFSDILAAIVFGFVVGNYVKAEMQEVPELTEIIMSPVVMLFFVVVGARMELGLFLGQAGGFVIAIALLYLVGRTAGKFAGAYVGARLAGLENTVRKYLGSCLMCQAGVALGLSFVVENRFAVLGGEAAEAGVLILSTVGLSTMILELVGPLTVKWGLREAGELGTDIECAMSSPMEYEDTGPIVSAEDEAASASSSPDRNTDDEQASSTSGPDHNDRCV